MRRETTSRSAISALLSPSATRAEHLGLARGQAGGVLARGGARPAPAQPRDGGARAEPASASRSAVASAASYGQSSAVQRSAASSGRPESSSRYGSAIQSGDGLGDAGALAPEREVAR